MQTVREKVNFTCFHVRKIKNIKLDSDLTKKSRVLQRAESSEVGAKGLEIIEERAIV